MPTTTNLTGGGVVVDSSGAVARSITFFAFADVDHQDAEVAPATAKYFRVTFFTANNAGGTNLGTATIDTTDAVFAHYGKANIQDALVAIFPPPGSTV